MLKRQKNCREWLHPSKTKALNVMGASLNYKSFKGNGFVLNRRKLDREWLHRPYNAKALMGIITPLIYKSIEWLRP